MRAIIRDRWSATGKRIVEDGEIEEIVTSGLAADPYTSGGKLELLEAEAHSIKAYIGHVVGILVDKNILTKEEALSTLFPDFRYTIE